MIAKLEIAVVDTNIFVSAMIFRGSVPRRALDFALGNGVVLSSAATRNEPREVFRREKFDRFVSLEDRIEAVEWILEDMQAIEIRAVVCECRDAKDDKFLELAVNGGAGVIITGDIHLLEMHPFRIAIMAPGEYLKRVGVSE